MSVLGHTVMMMKKPTTSTFRYLRWTILTQNRAGEVDVGEVNWKVSGVDYPTQTMTSNTTPSPLVVTRSKALSSTYEAWKVFNNDGNTSNWAANQAAPNWVQIDLGSGNGVTPTGIGITPTYNNDYVAT